MSMLLVFGVNMRLRRYNIVDFFWLDGFVSVVVELVGNLVD